LPPTALDGLPDGKASRCAIRLVGQQV